MRESKVYILAFRTSAKSYLSAVKNFLLMHQMNDCFRALVDLGTTDMGREAVAIGQTDGRESASSLATFWLQLHSENKSIASSSSNDELCGITARNVSPKALPTLCT